MSKQAIELMFGDYRRRLLATLLLRPDERFHVRELGRMTGIPAGSLHRELKIMGEAGVLTRDQVGNQVLYQADRSCPIFEELASILQKTIGLAMLLREPLQHLDDKIEMALVFGSMASGQQRPTSDIDVLVLGDVTLSDVVVALAPCHETLGREINPVVMAADRFIAQLREQQRFAMRVFEEPKIFVIGDENEFAELIANRKAR